MGAYSSPSMPSRTPEPSADPAAMLGPESSGPQASGPEAKPQPDQQEALRQVMAQFRDLNSQIEALARQFPQAAKPSQKASDAVREMMMTVTTALTRGQEQGKPPVLG